MENYEEIGILIVEDNPRDVAECYRPGVNSYVVKPVRFEALAETVTGLGRYWMLTNRVPEA